MVNKLLLQLLVLGVLSGETWGTPPCAVPRPAMATSVVLSTTLHANPLVNMISRPSTPPVFFKDRPICGGFIRRFFPTASSLPYMLGF